MRITPKDRKVIQAFYEHTSAESKNLSTDGKVLDGQWMGGRSIAEWEGNKIKFNDLGSKASQTVQRAVTKYVPKNTLKLSSTRRTASEVIRNLESRIARLERLGKQSSSRTSAPDPRFAANALATNVMSSRSSQVKNALKNGLRRALKSYEKMTESQSPAQVIRSQKFYDIATNCLMNAVSLQAEIDKAIAYKTQPKWMSDRELEAGFSDSVITMASQQLVQTYSAYITGKSDIDAL